jgi:5-hydroxyisourate hydrolase-like protein (transthyretin family)
MIITGTVTDFETGAPVENLEVRLYTYEEKLSPTVFPGKDKIASTRTNDHGKYQFEVMLGQYDKVVIQLESGQWAPVEVKEGLIEINLQKGAPMPC